MNPKKPRALCAANCGKSGKTARSRFCSSECHHRARFRTNVDLLERGLYPAKPFSSSFIRKYLVTRDGERCIRCGWAERNLVSGNVPIEVEHIDGAWRNNLPANLVLSCPNCHSLTPTFRGLNKGRGREARVGSRINPLVSRGTVPKPLG